MNIYQQQILDHYHNPRNFGELEEPTHLAEAENLTCGDEVRFFLQVDEQSRIAKASFTGAGCAISIASASLLTEMLLGKNTQDIPDLDQKDILEMLGITLTTSRLRCALLPLEAVKKAIANLQPPSGSPKLSA